MGPLSHYQSLWEDPKVLFSCLVKKCSIVARQETKSSRQSSLMGQKAAEEIIKQK